MVEGLKLLNLNENEVHTLSRPAEKTPYKDAPCLERSSSGFSWQAPWNLKTLFSGWKLQKDRFMPGNDGNIKVPRNETYKEIA